MANEVKEVTVILKDSERSYKQKFLCYEDITVSSEDPTIKDYIKISMTSFGFEPEDVKIRILLQV